MSHYLIYLQVLWLYLQNISGVHTLLPIYTTPILVKITIISCLEHIEQTPNYPSYLFFLVPPQHRVARVIFQKVIF